MSGPGRPTLAELRAVAQPESTMSRRNAEHWLARLFLRKVKKQRAPSAAAAIPAAVRSPAMAPAAAAAKPALPRPGIYVPKQ